MSDPLFDNGWTSLILCRFVRTIDVLMPLYVHGNYAHCQDREQGYNRSAEAYCASTRVPICPGWAARWGGHVCGVFLMKLPLFHNPRSTRQPAGGKTKYYKGHNESQLVTTKDPYCVYSLLLSTRGSLLYNKFKL
jgi:hypothetical protein